MGPHSSILAWRIPWTEEPGGLQSMGSHRVRHSLATKPSSGVPSHVFLGRNNPTQAAFSCQVGGQECWAWLVFSQVLLCCSSILQALIQFTFFLPNIQGLLQWSLFISRTERGVGTKRSRPSCLNQKPKVRFITQGRDFMEGSGGGKWKGVHGRLEMQVMESPSLEVIRN